MIMLLLVGCGGSEETVKNTSPAISRKEFLAKYERTFNPVDFDEDVNIVKAEEKKQQSALDGPSLLVTALPETIPGFRIQLLLTKDIDEANAVKDSVTSHIPDDWAYIIYDSPYYKVRFGNFSDHISANVALKRLINEGYQDAWVVPDNVLKNPPPRTPEIQIEPGKPLDKLR